MPWHILRYYLSIPGWAEEKNKNILGMTDTLKRQQDCYSHNHKIQSCNK
jgi:hypothetical protein